MRKIPTSCQACSYLVVSFLCLMGLSSCGPNYIFDETKQIQEQAWTYADSLDFRVSIADTNKVFNLYLDIDHQLGYPFENLYLMVHTTFPSGQRLNQRLSVNFMDKAGKLHGDCSGEHCSLRVRMQEKAYFSEAGDYQFSIEQFTRQDSLPGIRSLALRIEDLGMDRSKASSE
ncbi:MAG: gliding motility lipoprotein GldH [Bacteroidota bacterium]